MININFNWSFLLIIFFIVYSIFYKKISIFFYKILNIIIFIDINTILLNYDFSKFWNNFLFFISFFIFIIFNVQICKKKWNNKLFLIKILIKRRFFLFLLKIKKKILTSFIII